MKEDLTALELVQKIGASTMFTDCNEGMSLPLEIAKKIATTTIIALWNFPSDKWQGLINEIEEL
jgi:hypothetical protein